MSLPIENKYSIVKNSRLFCSYFLLGTCIAWSSISFGQSSSSSPTLSLGTLLNAVKEFDEQMQNTVTDQFPGEDEQKEEGPQTSETVTLYLVQNSSQKECFDLFHGKNIRIGTRTFRNWEATVAYGTDYGGVREEIAGLLIKCDPFLSEDNLTWIGQYPDDSKESTSEPSLDGKVDPTPSREANDEKLLGLWKSNDNCFVHIYEDYNGNLGGAAWGKHKESGKLDIEVAPERRFLWKRSTKKSSFGDDGELDPKGGGKFIVDLYDRSVLYSNVSPCFIKKGSSPKWKRVVSDRFDVGTFPNWYQDVYGEVVAEIEANSERVRAEKSAKAAADQIAKEKGAKAVEVAKAEKQLEVKKQKIAEAERQVLESNAMILLEDIQGFLRENPTSNHVLELFELSVVINTALKAGSPQDVSLALVEANQTLELVEGLAEYREIKKQERIAAEERKQREEEARLLAEQEQILEKAISIRDNLKTYIIENLTDPAIAEKVSELNELNLGIENKDYEGLFSILSKYSAIDIEAFDAIVGEWIETEDSAGEFISINPDGQVCFKEHSADDSCHEFTFISLGDNRFGIKEDDRYVFEFDGDVIVGLEKGKKFNTYKRSEESNTSGSSPASPTLSGHSQSSETANHNQVSSENSKSGATAEVTKEELVAQLIETGNCDGCDLSGTNLQELKKLGPGVGLRGANLSGADLSGTKLKGADLFDANLESAVLNDVNLKNANMDGVNLSNATIARANINGVDFSNADFSNATLRGLAFEKAGFQGAVWAGAKLDDLTRESLQKGYETFAKDIPLEILFASAVERLKVTGDCEECDLSETDLRNVDLTKARLSKAILSGANFAGTTLENTDFSSADLSNANLTNVKFRGVRLQGANFSGANLSGSELKGADLSELNFENAELSNVNFWGAIFRGANLSNAMIIGCDFNGAQLNNANLSNATLNDLDLKKVRHFQNNVMTGVKLDESTRESLQRSNFKKEIPLDVLYGDSLVARLKGTGECEGCDLSGADLRNSDLRRASLIGANLSGADLSGSDLGLADLSDANLTNTTLSGVDFTSARLKRASFEGAMIDDKTRSSLSRAKLVPRELSISRFSGSCSSRLSICNTQVESLTDKINHTEKISEKSCKKLEECISERESYAVERVPKEKYERTRDSLLASLNELSCIHRNLKDMVGDYPKLVSVMGAPPGFLRVNAKIACLHEEKNLTADRFDAKELRLLINAWTAILMFGQACSDMDYQLKEFGEFRGIEHGQKYPLTRPPDFLRFKKAITEKYGLLTVAEFEESVNDRLWRGPQWRFSHKKIVEENSSKRFNQSNADSALRQYCSQWPHQIQIISKFGSW